VTRNRIPQALSTGEETLWLNLRVAKLNHRFEREYPFSPPRLWRADFACLAFRLLIEVEGATRFGIGRHSQGAGFEDDCRKYNAAAREGWRVLRFSSKMVMSGEAIAAIEDVFAVEALIIDRAIAATESLP
jgi:very-short-patch-repair endonuclease